MLWSSQRGSGPSQPKSIVTVTVPAGSYNLITVADFKTDQNITDTSQDARIALLVAQASALIASYCNRTFVAETLSEKIRHVYTDALILARFPVTSITSVVQDGVTLDTADYEVDPDTGILSRLSDDSLSYWRAAKIVVTYVCGYTTIPADISRACLDAVRYFQVKASRDPTLKSLELPDVSVEEFWVGSTPGQSDSGGLPPEIAAVLDGYVAQRIV